MGRPVLYPNLPTQFLIQARHEMTEQGVSITELSRELGSSRSSLSRVLAGKHSMSFDQAKKLNKLLGLNFNLPEPDSYKKTTSN